MTTREEKSTHVVNTRISPLKVEQSSQILLMILCCCFSSCIPVRRVTRTSSSSSSSSSHPIIISTSQPTNSFSEQMKPETDKRIEKIKEKLRYFSDFPKPGIRFVDIFPVFEHPVLFQQLLDICKEHIEQVFERVDYIVGVELRGCLFGVPLALQMGKPFVPVRKRGKLPGPVIQQRYGTEYSQDAMEMQQDSLIPGSKVLIIDDLLATGGTMIATRELVTKLNCEVLECLVIIELSGLGAREAIMPTIVHSVITV